MNHLMLFGAFAAMSLSSAGAATADWADCRIIVNGRTALDAPCEKSALLAESGALEGSFRLRGDWGTAELTVTGDGEARGTWKEATDIGKGEDLGHLFAKDGCWVGGSNRICAPPLRPQKPEATSSGGNDVADDKSYGSMREYTALSSKVVSGTRCRVVGVADFDAFSSHIPDIRKDWLNEEYSVDFYRQRPKQVFAYVVLKRYAEVLTESLYREQQPNRCYFSILIAYNDKYGQTRRLDALSWEFTSELNKKVNWDKVHPRNFHEIAISYKLNPKISEWMSDEPSLSQR